jgi:hypothetical protein
MLRGKKIIKNFFGVIILSMVLAIPCLVNAQLQTMNNVANYGGYDVDNTNEFTMSGYIGLIVNAFLSLLGIIFLILIIWAGYNWMTAGGDESKVTKAKDTLYRAVIGLIIVVGAFSIFRFIFLRLAGQ